MCVIQRQLSEEDITQSDSKRRGESSSSGTDGLRHSSIAGNCFTKSEMNK